MASQHKNGAETRNGVRDERGRIEAAGRRRIGTNLRLLYASVLEQPLPERFTRLLDDLSNERAAATDTTSREGSR